MAEPLSDFSKIRELQEIKKLHDELQERHAQEVREKDREIERLRAAIDEAAPRAGRSEAEEIRAENERLSRQIQLVRQEFEAKVERLNARIRELSAPAGPAGVGGGEGDRKGFFRR